MSESVVLALVTRTCCTDTLSTWSCACCATMTAWALERTSWLSRPRTHSRKSAASGCTSAAARWGDAPQSVMPGVLLLWNSCFLFFFLGAGSVHLQGAVGFLRLCSVLRQVLMVGQMEEIWGDKRNHCKWQRQISETVRICFNFPSFYHQMLTEWW